jgi:phosphohistidine phosphatase
MKTLIVLRHAKAERDSATGRDFDRPLAERGWKDARAVGAEARKRGLRPDKVLASPAKRVVETVAAFEEGFGPVAVSYDEHIYDAPVSRLLETVGEADDAVGQLLLVGHNPGAEQLLLRVAGDDSGGYLDRIADGFPTAALAGIELPVDHWRDAGQGIGRVLFLIAPRDLD